MQRSSRVHPALLAVLLVAAGVVLVMVLPPPWGPLVLFVLLAPGFGLVSGLLAARQAEAGGTRARWVAGLLRSVAARPVAWAGLVLVLVMAGGLWGAGMGDLAALLAVVPLFLGGYGAGLLRWVPASWMDLDEGGRRGASGP